MFSNWPVYDNAGNMISDGLNNYAFDAENRLISTSPANSLGGASATFGYGPYGDRVNKNGTYYIYSGSRPIAEYAGGASAGSPSAEYINLGGQQLASVISSAITYNYADLLSTRVATDSSGNPVRTYGHFPFGETWYETGTASKWKFTTYERDLDSSGLDYAGARFHSTRLGRFASMDPIDSINRYGYVENDPVNAIDPTGMFDFNFGSGCPFFFCWIVPDPIGAAYSYDPLSEVLGMPPGMRIPPITVDGLLRDVLGIPAYCDPMSPISDGCGFADSFVENLKPRDWPKDPNSPCNTSPLGCLNPDFGKGPCDFIMAEYANELAAHQGDGVESPWPNLDTAGSGLFGGAVKSAMKNPSTWKSFWKGISFEGVAIGAMSNIYWKTGKGSIQMAKNDSAINKKFAPLFEACEKYGFSPGFSKYPSGGYTKLEIPGIPKKDQEATEAIVKSAQGNNTSLSINRLEQRDRRESVENGQF